MGWNEATNDSMPFQPDDDSVAVLSDEINTMIAAIPYPILHTVAETADQNPIWLTDLGMLLSKANESCPLPTLKRAVFVVFTGSSILDVLFFRRRAHPPASTICCYICNRHKVSDCLDDLSGPLHLRIMAGALDQNQFRVW